MRLVRAGLQPVGDNDRSPIARVSAYLDSGRPSLAVLAPEAIGAFPGADPGQVESALRRAGFSGVEDTSIGCAMVNQAYHDFLESPPDRPVIRSTCPAIVNFIEIYRPELIPFLAPFVDPMVAHGRLISALSSDTAVVVYISACIAAKSEVSRPGSLIDEMMTVVELNELLNARGIDPVAQEAGRASETLNSGAKDMTVDNFMGVGPGPQDTLVARSVDEAASILSISALFKQGAFRWLDLMACDDCARGPAGVPPIGVRRRFSPIFRGDREKDQSVGMVPLPPLDLSRTFTDRRIAKDKIDEERVRENLFEAGLGESAWRLNCSICGYETCEEHAVAVLRGFSEWTACFPAEKRRLSATSPRRVAPGANEGLTGSPPRAELLDRLRKELERSRQRQSVSCLILVEVGSLSRINSDEGRDVGDTVLQLIAQIMQDAVGVDGDVVRYGGDSFVIILPDTPKAQGQTVAGSVAELIKSALFWAGARTHSGLDVVTAVVEVGPTERDSEVLRELEAALIDEKSAKSTKWGRSRS